MKSLIGSKIFVIAREINIIFNGKVKLNLLIFQRVHVNVPLDSVLCLHYQKILLNSDY